MVSTIQPVSRHWTFQLIESGIFAALTIVLVVLTVRWIRRRIAEERSGRGWPPR
jgi:hypothetical protein